MGSEQSVPAAAADGGAQQQQQPPSQPKGGSSALSSTPSLASPGSPSGHHAAAGAAANPLASGAGGPAIPSALIVVGPSGVGKNTLIARLRDTIPGDPFGFSVSHTTRKPRPGEQHGRDYYFTTHADFEAGVAQGLFIEHAFVHGNLYGTSILAVRDVLEAGRCCILDIDVQGARSVRQTPLKAIYVFVAPPSLEDLAKRLTARGTEDLEHVRKRLSAAKAEINSVNERGLYDYLIINDSLEDAVGRLRGVALRALQGLEPEPGKMPESVLIEDAPLPNLELLAAQSNGPGLAAPTPVHVPAGSSSSGLGSAESNQPLPLSPPVPTPEQLQQLSQMAAASPAAPAALAGLSDPGLLKWKDQVALVTGASSGIGWAISEVLAQHGMRVVAVARRKEKLEALQAHMHSMQVPATHFLPVVCDMTKDAEVATLPRIVAKRWPDAGGVDVLVNNAGLSRSDASLMGGNVASWVEMLSTNVLGTAMAIKAITQDMRRRGKWGHIINMVGLSGHRIPDGPQGGGFYCATKSAVKTITEGLRQEARGQQLPLRVSAISPGVVETEFFMVKHFGNEAAARSSTSAFACLQPADVAQAVLWCLSAPAHVEVDDVVVRPTQQLL